MQRLCPVSGGTFEVDDDDLSFLDRISPVIGGQKYPIPPPTLSPRARLQRRLAFRNQVYVFFRPSSLSGKPIFSMFDEQVPFPVYGVEEWWGDSWDALDYGRDFDFSRPFFEQFKELRDVVPHLALSVLHSDNSEYCSNAGWLKNCYFIFNSTYVEDCMYGEGLFNSKNCLECTYTKESELCADCVICQRCYNLQSSQECQECTESYFLLNCIACNNCYACVNLRHKQYHIFNRPYTREAYQEFIAAQTLGSNAGRSKLRAEAEKFWHAHPRPHIVACNTEDCNGNHLYECKNVHDSFFIRDGENLRYCFAMEKKLFDCRDCAIPGVNSSQMYECLVAGLDAHDMQFCYWVAENCAAMRLCWLCFQSHDCFGCVGLRHKQYCVFNKQYTKDEYELLTGRIIQHMQQTGEWGEFFPLSFSPHPYNLTYAQRYFPLSCERAAREGLRWAEPKKAKEVPGAISAAALPDELPAQSEPLVATSILSGLPFKITSREIELCRKFQMPLPRTTYDERLHERFAKLEGIRLFRRTCAKSGRQILTPYSSATPWIVWEREEYEREFN